MNQSFSILLLLALVVAAAGFTASLPRFSLVSSQPTTPFFRLHSTEQDNEDFPQEEGAEEYTGSVDWDAEWKKVVASEGRLADGSERPGRDFYKSEAEIAAIKAANKAAEKAAEAGSNVANSMPDIRSLSGDWKVSLLLI